HLREAIYDWLSAPNPSNIFNEAHEKCTKGTGDWFINGMQFAGWKAQCNQCLWIYGIPGSGKTVLCSSIIDNLQNHCDKHPSHLLLYFFFDSRDLQDGFQLHQKLICSLVKQVISKCFDIPHGVLEIYKDGMQQPCLASLEITFSCLLAMFDHAYIVLDAIDECSEPFKVLKWLKGLLKQHDQSLHIIVTARPEVSIRRILDSINHESLFLERVTENNDICIYIHVTLQDTGHLYSLDSTAQDTLVKTLKEKAEGMFRWVALQLEELQTCYNDTDLEEQLSRLPTGLDELYKKMVLRIPPKWKADALKFFQWLAFSIEPLKVHELAEITGINMDYDVGDVCMPFNRRSVYRDPMDILSVCSGLVIHTEGTFKLAHMSVKEYLMSNHYNHPTHSTLYLEERMAHRVISKMCLTYLFQFQDQFSPKTMDQKSLERLHPLIQYSASGWILHANHSQHGILDKYHNLIMKLFEENSNQFMVWSPRSFQYPWQAHGDESPMYLAAYHGLYDVSVTLLERKADINIQRGHYGSAVIAAAYQGHMDIVQLLVENGADMITQAGDFKTPLIAAAHKGHVDVVQFLLSIGVDVNTNTGEFGTALIAAALEGHVDVIKLLVAKGADVNADVHNHGTALIAATHEGHIDVIQLLFNTGADVNVQTKEFGTALMIAAHEGHIDIVNLLLREGADVNAQVHEHGTALMIAAHTREIGIIKLLLDFGGDVDAVAGSYGTALITASYGGCVEVVQVLLYSHPNINAQAGESGTALIAAASRGHLEVVKLLLHNKADVNLQGGEYATALIAAADEGHMSVIQLLLHEGADSTTVTQYHGTALHAAAHEGYIDAVKLFLSLIRDINLQAGYYGTALMAAAHGGEYETIRLLACRGADINVKGGEFGTALIAAAHEGYLESVEILLSLGADVNAQAGKYGTALIAASQEGFIEVVQLLLTMGADINAQTSGFGSALITAINSGQLQIVQLLLSRGADVNLQTDPTEYYGTALIAAAFVGEIYVVHLLSQLQVDINAQTHGFCTALIAAVCGGHQNIVQLLLRMGANVNIQSLCYGTALIAAVNRNYIDIVQLLLRSDHSSVGSPHEGEIAVEELLKQVTTQLETCPELKPQIIMEDMTLI
ncbi:ankyrin repeat-containing domain protein, partial [Hysterangium stoloniferum]